MRLPVGPAGDIVANSEKDGLNCRYSVEVRGDRTEGADTGGIEILSPVVQGRLRALALKNCSLSPGVTESNDGVGPRSLQNTTVVRI